MEPLLKKKDKEMFYKYLDKASVYFEYGSGGSTYQASIRNNIKKIYSVESDLEWHNKLKSSIKDTSKITFLYNEMNSLPKTFGSPGPNATPLQQINYSNQLSLLTDSQKKEIDLILIDGRFRVACCLKCFDEINNNCTIIFDDFLNRPHYHIVLKYFTIIDKTVDKCMVVLKKRADVQSIPDDVIKQYELIKE